MSKFCPLAMSKLNLKLALQQTTSVLELVFDNDNKSPKKWGETCETRASASEVCDLDFN